MKGLAVAGIISGIKVDTGETNMAGHPGEQMTEGLDGLRDRLTDLFFRSAPIIVVLITSHIHTLLLVPVFCALLKQSAPKCVPYTA